MEQLKAEIYWACDQLRRYESWDMQTSKVYTDLLQKVKDLQAKYDQAKRNYNAFLDKCSKEYY